MTCTLTKYFLGDQIKINEMGGECGRYGGEDGAYRVLAGKPEEKRTLGRPRCRWKDNMKLDLHNG
jgi:hypothetical protein